MSIDCKNKNLLQRSGINQHQRALKALAPHYAKVDERTTADLILFAKYFGSHLKYFNAADNADGDWQPLMSGDISVTLAALVKFNVRGCFDYSKEIFSNIQAIDGSHVADLQNYFKLLFDFAFTLTTTIDAYYKALPFDFSFKDVLGQTIQSNLPEYYDRLKKYYGQAIIEGLINPAGAFSLEPSPVTILLSQNFDASGLSDKWFEASVPAFTPTFNGISVSLKIKNTSTHNLFTGIFDQYLKTLTRIVELSSVYLEQTLTSFPTHTPHYALYLAFIKLFGFAQNHINEFSQRHLDLYYKDILQLHNKNAVADTAYLTFELSKSSQENHQLKKGAIFKAGKDVDGQDIFYALNNDVVLNKGVVTAIKSIFVDRDLATGTKQLFSNPIANSEDGFGAKLQSADKSWKIFGDATRTEANIGFVIASHYLYLREGVRNIIFQFFTSPGEILSFGIDDIQSLFTLQLTGPKGWVDVDILPANVLVHDNSFSVSVTLDGGVPAIVPYSQKLHGNNLDVSMPAAKFLVRKAKAKDSIWNFILAKVDITVNVTGVKNVLIQNDSGNLKSSKPFDMFGSSPHVGSSFIVSNKEIFIKALRSQGNVMTKVNLTWDNYTELIDRIAANNRYTVDVYHLEDAEWKKTAENKKLFNNTLDVVSPIEVHPKLLQFKILSGGTLQFQKQGVASFGSIGSDLVSDLIRIDFIRQTSVIDISIPALSIEPDFGDDENYDAKSVWGFLKLELNAPEFGHSTYASDLADAARNATITSTDNGDGTTSTKVDIKKIPEPYTPKVKTITLDYVASTSIDLNATGSFTHVTSFGSEDIFLSPDKNLLSSVANEGELFLGIGNCKGDQTLSILFQVADGTADPLTAKQALSWSYLSDNNAWVFFKNEDVADGTNDLTKSGIIKFGIPESISFSNTIMHEQLLWIRGTMVEKTNAVCKLIAVTAQAARANFFDYRATGNYYKSVLPVNSISKLLISDASVKKITQPIPSVGGRTKESDDHFYVRVSERLRHKSRAIAMWDYERIVLEAFSSVYKVKCINHTQILEKSAGTKIIYVDNELKPGYVLVVPIPDLQNKNTFDPLRPYCSLGLLADIKRYLSKYISPHVNLDVRNPMFEEIQLEFKIKYLTDDNDFLTKQLRLEIQQFMAPWAFDSHTDFEFGGKINKSTLIDFIEGRSYVDYLTCVKMYRIVDGVKSGDADEMAATTARSVFVSVKSDDEDNAHKISFVNENCDC